MTEFRNTQEDVFYVYKHLRKDTGEPFYVGIGKKYPKKKYTAHIYSRAYATTSRTKHWTNIIKKYGYTVEIIADNVPSLEEVYAKEKEMIAFYGRMMDGGKLCNISLGGDGAPGRVVSDETKKKLAAANIGKKHKKESIEKLKMTARTFQEVIDKYVMPCPITGCWHWMGVMDENRPVMCFKSKRDTAYRTIYKEINNTPLKHTELLSRTCINVYCVNPQHFTVITPSQRNIKMINESVHGRGEGKWNAKLSEDDVLDIRKLKNYGYSNLLISKFYSVTSGAIASIDTAKTWAWL